MTAGPLQDWHVRPMLMRIKWGHMGNLNRYGAAVQLPRELAVGSTVVLDNRYGAKVSARVVAQVNLLEGGVRAYGIEFVEQDEHAKDFWGIVFPTA